MSITVDERVGDILEVHTDAVVNPWNTNRWPTWILRPHGVSGALKKRTGPAPWEVLHEHGPIPPGGGVLTDGGDLGRPIIHVAGINWRWHSSSSMVHAAATTAIRIAEREGFQSLAMPLIGSGSGGLSPAISRRAILDAAHDAAPTVERELQLMLVALAMPTEGVADE